MTFHPPEAGSRTGVRWAVTNGGRPDWAGSGR